MRYNSSIVNANTLLFASGNRAGKNSLSMAMLLWRSTDASRPITSAPTHRYPWHSSRHVGVPAVSLCVALFLTLLPAFASLTGNPEQGALNRFTSGLFPAASAADTNRKSVVTIPVHGIIDLGLAYFVERSLENAQRDGAAAVIIELNTLGGRVDAALDIRDALESCKIPTTAYVNKRAISAGALICLATKRIAMAPGSTIGAATPVSIGSMGEKQQLGEKEISFVRGEFRATAERNGHSPMLAEAMVDPDVEVMALVEGEQAKPISSAEAAKLQGENKSANLEVISPKGKLLTMTSAEASRLGLAQSTPASLDELVRSLNFDPANMATAKVSWSENIVRFLTHPIVSGLLLTFGVLGLFFELQIPGWGLSGTVGVTCLLLFFGGHYLAGLASSIDVLLFVIGIGLLLLEILVIPGFGITGISGFVCILLGIYLALVRKPIPEFSWDYQALNTALGTIIFFLLAVTAGIVIVWKTFPESRLKKMLVLSTSESAKEGYVSSESLEPLVGRSATSLTPLRPAGRAIIAGEPFEVQTQGEFVEKDRPLKVVKVVGNKLFVAEAKEGTA